MDFQNRVGSKVGAGGVASASESNRARRDRLRALALETIDLNKDPYFMTNHLGGYECKLCLTLHTNEGSYLAHTQAKKHQENLKRRAFKEAKEAEALPAPLVAHVDKKKFVKIGNPGYKVTKQRDPETLQNSMLFQVDYPEITEGVEPKHRFMAAFEQKVEAPDRDWQYILFAAEPYNTIGFKISSREIDTSKGKMWTFFNEDTKSFFLQFHFKADRTRDNTRQSSIGFQPPANPLNPYQGAPPPPMQGGPPMHMQGIPPPMHMQGPPMQRRF